MAVERLEVVFRSDAADDLDAIYRWIYKSSLEPATAWRYVERIVAFCEKIGGMARRPTPRRSHARITNVSLRAAGRGRRLIVGEMAEITNVFHGGRDYEALYRDRVQVEDADEP